MQSQHRQKQGLKQSLKKSDIEVIKLDWRMKPYMNLSSERKGNILREAFFNYIHKNRYTVVKVQRADLTCDVIKKLAPSVLNKL